jgi:hypothetical protein
MTSTHRKRHYLALKVDSGEPKDWQEHVEGLLQRHCLMEGEDRPVRPSKTMRFMLATPSGALEPAFETTEIRRGERYALSRCTSMNPGVSAMNLKLSLNRLGKSGSTCGCAGRITGTQGKRCSLCSATGTPRIG